MTNKELYIVKLIKGDRTRYLLYISDEIDTYMIDGDQELLVFDSILKLRSYCAEKDLLVEDDLSVITCPPEAVCASNIDEGRLLDFWNFCTDIVNSVGDSFLGDKREEKIDLIYTKMFAGNNTPAIKGDAEEYHPQWNDDEMRVINEVLLDGMRLINRYVKFA